MKYTEYRFDAIASTQDFLREKRKEGKNAVAIAKAQTGGKGTKGRSFECAEGGLWLSILLFHENLAAKDAFLMMARSAVAVSKTLEDYGLFPKIKWANDVLLDGKKVCGILTENIFKGGMVESTVFGIGLNVNNTLSESLADIATTMSQRCAMPINLAEVEDRLLGHFFAPFTFAEYANRLAYLGKEILFETNDRIFSATLSGVTDRGELILTENGASKTYAYGEISWSKANTPQGEGER